MNELEQSHDLLARIAGRGMRNLLVMGLHPGSGKQTVLSELARAAAAEGMPIALASAPRLNKHDDYSEEYPAVIQAQAGNLVVVGDKTEIPEPAALAILRGTGIASSRGELQLARVTTAGDVPIFGPSRPADMGVLREILLDHEIDHFCVAAGQDHRSFLEPGLFDGVVLSSGLGMAPSEERAAAATRYQVETLDLDVCDDLSRLSFDVVRSTGDVVIADRNGTVCCTLSANPGPVSRWLAAQDQDAGYTVILPAKLTDDLLRPMVKAGLTGTIVVHDVTRIAISPIYFKAWIKNGGRLEVVVRTDLVALAVNPTDRLSGERVDSARFQERLMEHIRLPIHDVAQEALGTGKKRSWKFWN
jgi:hypothetical protein